MCEKKCLQCQFFCIYGYHQLHGKCQRVVTQKERSELKRREGINSFPFGCMRKEVVDYETYLCCYKEVWDAANFINTIKRGATSYQELGNDEKELEEILWKTVVKTERNDSNPRGNNCFYFEYQESMSLEAADELEKRETIQKEAAADRKWTRWGVWATFSTAFLSAIVAIGIYVLKRFVN